MIIELEAKRPTREKARLLAKRLNINIEELDSTAYAIGVENLESMVNLSEVVEDE